LEFFRRLQLRRMSKTHLAASVPNFPSALGFMIAALTYFSGVCGMKFSEKIKFPKKRGFNGLSAGPCAFGQGSRETCLS
jgi:hypothetical protein